MKVFGSIARRGKTLSLLLIDINRFHWVNDTFGLEVGDHVLEVVGTAIKRAVGPEGVVGRLNGSRFGALAFLPSESAAVGLGQEVLALVGNPIRVTEGSVHVTGCVGIVQFQGLDGAVATRMLRYAESALSAAKASASSVPVVVCTDADRAQADLRARICRELPQAIDDGLLRVAYQPIVDLSSLRTVSYEALVRWQASSGVDLPPSQVVSIAEDLGLIGRLGSWVLNEAVFVASTLTALAAPKMHMAVNLSPQQFADQNLLDLVIRTLQKHQLDPAQLVFEITESIAVDDRRAASTLRELRRLGCRVGIDDFGTGQSCLSYLRSLPLDFIKVDRSFIIELTSDARARRLVATIAAMASDLGMSTVAEGIETKAQCEVAADSGCSFGQGYLFGQAVFHPEFTTSSEGEGRL
jgi:diguanylate cyclase (GGDEF)-like protein